MQRRQRTTTPETGLTRRRAPLGAAVALLAALLPHLAAAQGRPQEGSVAPTRSVPAYRQADRVYIIPIRGPIDRVTAMSVERRVREATEAGADAIVLELDTPGGEVGAVLDICVAVQESIDNTVAWVHPEAHSGGAIAAMACREIVVSRSASFGDAKLVQIGFDPSNPLGSSGLIEPDDVAKEKLYPVMFERVNTFTRRHNEAFGTYARDELLSQALIASDAELWWIRDTKTGVEFAIDRAEYERLFPDEPILQPVLGDALVESAVQRSESEPDVGLSPDEQATAESMGGLNESERIRPASPDVARFAERIAFQQQLMRQDQLETRRPRIDFNDPGRYVLVDKLLAGSGAVVLNAEDMARFRLANNVDPTTGKLAPINSDADLEAFFLAKSMTRLEPSWSEGLVRFMSNPLVKGFLIVVFLLALFVEMTHPGVALPGAVALIALGGLLLPSYMVGLAGWWELAAILGGILLILLEILVIPGFGLPGVAGVVLVFGGLLGTFTGGSSAPGGEQGDLLYGLLIIVLAGGVSIVGMYFLAKHFGELPLIGRLVLRDTSDDDRDPLLSAMATPAAPVVAVGDEGVAATALRPAGRIELEGELVDVVAALGYIEPGQRVRVVEVTPFRVAVEAIADAPRA